MAKETFKASEAVLYLARYWAYMALAAFALYFVLIAIERRSELHIHIPGYRVPIEQDAEPAEKEEDSDGDI